MSLDSQPTNALSVFISYAHDDKRLRDQLEKHLIALQNSNVIKLWHDGEIIPGQEWEEVIIEQLNNADIILLLISANFLASKYIDRVELQRAMARHEEGQARVIPILLKTTHLSRTAFATLQALPVNAQKRPKAVTEWNNREAAFANIAAGIEQAAEDLLAQRALPPATPADPPDAAVHHETTLRLEQLPLDAIPLVATLPRGSRMPLSPNPLFVGREDDLKILAATLKGKETIAISPIAAATGLGGLGKTQLACEFVHRYGQFFEGVFWLNFADPNAIANEIAVCGGKEYLDLRPDFTNLLLDEQVKLVRSAWEDSRPRLLVFDNCEDEALFNQWRPSAKSGCRVLITSRRTRWTPTLGIYAHALDVLTPAQGVALLVKYCPYIQEDDPDLAAITQALEHLPLALHLSGSYLYNYQGVVSLADYLQEVTGPNPISVRALEGYGMDQHLSPTRHDEHVARTFALSYNKLDSTNAADQRALKLLARAAYFAPGENIPRSLLLETVREDAEHSAARIQAHDALQRLIALGLLEVEGVEELRLHRLLAAFVRAVTTDSDAQALVEQTLLQEGARLTDIYQLLPIQIILPHLRWIADMAHARQDAQAADLASVLSECLHILKDHSGAWHYTDQAWNIRQRILAPDHLDIAASLNNRGVLLQAQGDYASARLLLERALAIREQALGPTHPDTASSLNNLAGLLQAQADYAAARPLYEQALLVYEQVLGPIHPDTALSLNNLAALLQEQGDYIAARPLYERALAIREQALGPTHPDTASSLNNLAGLLKTQGDYASARPLYERALVIREQALGPTHPETAASLNNLAGLLKEQGDYAAAQPLLERALAICEQVLGPTHPDTASNLNNLANLLQDQGDYAAARPLLERALKIREQVLGATHPDTAASLNNLASLLQDQGDYIAARPLYNRALEIYEQVLGPTHPDTAIALNNLASLLQAQGDYTAARPLLERALVIHEQVLGPTHPDTAIALNNLARLRKDQGDIKAARALFQRAFTIYKRKLGATHPRTLAVKRALENLDRRRYRG